MKPRDDFELGRTELPRGASSIEASAGTGKTWTIAHLLPLLLLRGASPREAGIDTLDEAVLVTFTDDAARELGERVRRQLTALRDLLGSDPADSPLPAPVGEEGLARLLEIYEGFDAEKRRAAHLRISLAVQDADRLLVSTIHSFCRKVLADQSFLCGVSPGFDIEADDAALRERLMRDRWRSLVSGDDDLCHLGEALGWKAAELPGIWKKVTHLSSDRFHPAPSPLPEAVASWKSAWKKLAEDAKGWAELRAFLTERDESILKATRPHLENLLRAGGHPDPDRIEGAWMRMLVALSGLAEKEDQPFGKRKADENAAFRDLSVVKEVVRMVERARRVHLALVATSVEEAEIHQRRSLEERNVLTYDALIARLESALGEDHPHHAALRKALRERWRIALVDECQDTDARQLAIFRRIFLGEEKGAGTLDRRLVMIGDPKQSIYAFRGADLHAYLEAVAGLADEAKSGLTMNFRSAEGLVDGLNAVWKNAGSLSLDAGRAEPIPVARAKKKDADLPLPKGRKARLCFALVEREEGLERWSAAPKRRRNAAMAAACAIRKELEDPEILPDRMAVLTRSNAEAAEVRDALTALGIPAIIRDSGDVMKTEVATDLSRLMKAVLEPERANLRRLALATRLLGHGERSLRSMDDALEEAWRRRFLLWKEKWEKEGVAGWIAAVEASEGLGSDARTPLQRLAEAARGERHLTDWRHLAELLVREQTKGARAPLDLLAWLDRGRAEDGTPPADRERRLEEDASSVQIVTMHKAKGLEYDFVYCPFLWSAGTGRTDKATFVPGRRDGRRILLHRDLTDEVEMARIEAQAGREDLEESLRLAYVALTRARRKAWVLAGWIGYGGRMPLVPSALDWLLRERKAEETPTSWLERMKTQKRDLTQAEKKNGERTPPFLCEHRGTIEGTLRAACGDLVSIEPVLLEAQAWKGREGEATLAPARPLPPSLVPWRFTSFSDLAKGGHAPKDHGDDAVTFAPAPRPASKPSKEEGTPCPMEVFPRSRHTGLLFHDILQKWDFGDLEALRPEIDLALAARGPHGPFADGRAPDDVILSLLPEWRGVRLPLAGGTTLAEAARLPALSELEFWIPVSESGIGGPELAEVFLRHAKADERKARYAESLRSLPTRQIGGMLRGFIDRLVFQGDEWAVVDWKSNHLGSRIEDYSPERIWDCAAESHYLLQLHIYLVAFRRHLRSFQGPRLRGAALLFLRGLGADSDRSTLWIEADDALLDDLDALFTSAETSP